MIHSDQGREFENKIMQELKFVASWSAKIAEEEMSSPPPLETLSPIPMVTSHRFYDSSSWYDGF